MSVAGPGIAKDRTAEEWTQSEIVSLWLYKDKKITNVQLRATNSIKVQRRSAPETSDREWSATCKAHSQGTLDRKTNTWEDCKRETYWEYNCKADLMCKCSIWTARWNVITYESHQSGSVSTSLIKNHRPFTTSWKIFNGHTKTRTC